MIGSRNQSVYAQLANCKHDLAEQESFCLMSEAAAWLAQAKGLIMHLCSTFEVPRCSQSTTDPKISKLNLFELALAAV
jgi:hypothetical protein